MVLRHSCQRIRALHTSTRRFARAPPVSKPVSPHHLLAPHPPRARPPENDPTYTHPPSAKTAGSLIRGVQILKDRPEIVALPDEYYPDWLWQLLDDPASVEARQNDKKEIEQKKKIYIAQLQEEEMNRQLEWAKKSRVVPPGVHRTLEEKRAVRRDAQNEAWLAKHENQQEMPQFEMPPERSAKYHKKINKEKIKQDNYLRARGMK
jgi:Mitochondrial ribosomal protein L37